MSSDSLKNKISFQRIQNTELDSDDLPFNETERLQRDRQNLLLALELTNNKISGTDGAASLLGIKPTTLASRMKTLGIDRND